MSQNQDIRHMCTHLALIPGGKAVADTWNYWDYRACSIDCWRNYKPSGTDLIPLVIVMLIIRLIGGSGRRW